MNEKMAIKIKIYQHICLLQIYFCIYNPRFIKLTTANLLQSNNLAPTFIISQAAE